MKISLKRICKISSIGRSLRNLEFIEHALLSMRLMSEDLQYHQIERRLQQIINSLECSATY